MRLIKSVLLASSILAFALPAIPVYAVEIECKRFDTKCNKAQKKAEFTQAYFRIMDLGVKLDWDQKAIRESFTREEQRALKKQGFDVTSRNLVKALEKKYNETFADMDPAAWQAVLDSILDEEYVARQIKYKLMNVAVVDRLKNELKNSGKKTVKAKSGNFSTRSSSRPAVVVLEDMRRVQNTLMKELTKAGDSLDIDILADALEQTTIILIERGEKVTKKLADPKEFEKAVLKASKSSSVEPMEIVGKLAVAAPAIDIINRTVQAQYAASAEVQKMKQTGEDGKVLKASKEDIIDFSADLPKDISSLSLDQLRKYFPETTDEEYLSKMRSYARHAGLEKADALDNITIPEGAINYKKGTIYASAMRNAHRAGSQGLFVNKVLESYEVDGENYYRDLNEGVARVDRLQLLKKQLEVIENTANDKLTQALLTEKSNLQRLYDQELEQAVGAYKQLQLNNVGFMVLDQDDDRKDTMLDTLSDYLKANVSSPEHKKVLAGVDADLQQRLKLNEVELKHAITTQQRAASGRNNAQPWGFYGTVAMIELSTAKEYQKFALENEQSGNIDLAEEYRNKAFNHSIIALRSMNQMAKTKRSFKAALGPVTEYLQEYVDTYLPPDVAKKYEPNLRRYYRSLNSSWTKKHSRELELEREDAAEAINMAELANEIAKIQDAIDNIQQEYDKAVSMGASHEEATAYMQDQQAQMQAGMAELCNAGDSSAC